MAGLLRHGGGDQARLSFMSLIRQLGEPGRVHRLSMFALSVI
jgi:hypothetical protein